MTDLNQLLRPKTWNQVVGQGTIKEICQRLIKENKFPKFSIFYGPTGVGKSCISEMIAIQLTNWEGPISNCPSITKYNMASLVGKKDIVEILDGIFKFKTNGITVFILEEVQVLKKEEQSPFLEELTKIPDNVYIMMCTTKVTALLPEMRNRAILYQLTLPTMDECKDYISDILETLDYSPMTDKAKELLIKASNYTPRSIVKHIELLASGSEVSEAEIIKFFNAVSNADYINSVAALTDPNISLYDCVAALEDILHANSVTNFIYGLRDFVSQVLIEKASKRDHILLTKEERLLYSEKLSHLNEVSFVRFFDVLGKTDLYHIETYLDALAVCIKVKLATMNLVPSDILKSNESSASEALISNKQQARHLAQVKHSGVNMIKPVDTQTNLSALGIEDVIYKE